MADHRLARLDRDRPDLAERVQAGEPCARDIGLLAGSNSDGFFMTSAIREKIIGGAAVFAAFGYLGAIIAGFINWSQSRAVLPVLKIKNREHGRTRRREVSNDRPRAQGQGILSFSLRRVGLPAWVNL
jgi:hypothetical protein